MCSHDAPQASVILRRSSPRMQHALVSSQLSTSTNALRHPPPACSPPYFAVPPDLTPHTSPSVVPIALHSYLSKSNTTAALQPSPIWAAPMGPAAVDGLPPRGTLGGKLPGGGPRAR